MSTPSDFHRSLGRLAKTNKPPSTQDATLIREIVCDIEKRTNEALSQLRALEDTLEDLDHERQFFEPLLSPMRRMPLEVLGEIFTQAVEAGGQSPLARISRVSKGWREAAHLVPSLWSEITIDPSDPNLSYEAVSSWLSHSRGRPRSIMAHSKECRPNLEDDWRRHCMEGGCVFARRAVVEILTATPNLESVTISCPTARCFNYLVHHYKFSCSLDWHKVKSFTMDWTRWRTEWEDVRFGATSRFLPSAAHNIDLHLPWIGDLPVDSPDPALDIPPITLKRLTSLNLTCDWGGDTLFRMLTHCTNLEEMQIETGGSKFEWDPQDPFMQNISHNGLVLHKLKSIRLGDVDTASMETLKFLKTPSISVVHIQFGTDDWSPDYPNRNPNKVTPDDIPSFVTFLVGKTDSPSTLRQLHISGGVFEADAMLRTLQHMPHLEQLTLANAVFPDDVFMKVSAKKLLPKLRSLILTFLHVNPDKLSGLDDFVVQRGITLHVERCRSVDCQGAD